MGPPDATTWEYPGEDTSWSAEFAHVSACIRDGRPCSGDLDDAVAALRIVEQLYERRHCGLRDPGPHDYHEESSSHLARRWRHRSAVVLPRAHRLHRRRRHRQVRLHHPAPDVRGRVDRQVLEDGTGPDGRGGPAPHHPRGAEAHAGLGSLPRDCEHGRYSGRHGAGFVGQLHDGAAESAARAPQAPHPPRGARRAGVSRSKSIAWASRSASRISTSPPTAASPASGSKPTARSRRGRCGSIRTRSSASKTTFCCSSRATRAPRRTFSASRTRRAVTATRT